MTQTSLFDTEPVRAQYADKIVNVSSVQQRSPFRYPGGKTWLVPKLRYWLQSLPSRPSLFVEPFAGGGICSLTVAFEGLAEHVLMIEKDADIAAVWHTILNGGAEWLSDQIVTFNLSRENLDASLTHSASNVWERSFLTILKNRTYHGGILAPGSRPINYGENGRGIASRWYPQTLRRRILAISMLADKIDFIEGDAFEILSDKAADRDAVWFIDPPYTAAGKKAGARLYTHFSLDHDRLFSEVQKIQGDFLMTYDNADGVRKLAERHGFDTENVAMKNTHHAEMSELLIGKNLDWVRV